MKKSGTKRALFLSVLSVVLCLAMLMGSTFAWFTDSVSTGVNKIVAGNLDVKLSAKTRTSEGYSEYAEVTDETNLFMDGALWEPGHVEVVNLKIENLGTLALKYQLGVNIVSETPGLNVYNTEFKLSDYIYYAVIAGEFEYANRDDAIAAAVANAPKKISAIDYSSENILVPKDKEGVSEQLVTLIVYMPTDTDNDANYMTGETAQTNRPEITLGVNLVATQTPYEADSFGTDYDKNVTYPILSTADLQKALASASSGDEFRLGSGTFELPAEIAEGVIISGSGAETVLKVDTSNQFAVGESSTKVNNGQRLDKPVTIQNVTLVGNETIGYESTVCPNGYEYAGVVRIESGGITLDNVSIPKTTVRKTSAIVVGAGLKQGDTFTISNSSITGGFKAIHIVDGCNGKIVIDNCEIDSTYPFNVNSGSSQNCEVEVKGSKLHGWTSYSAIKSVSFADTEFSMGTSGYDFIRPYADTTFTNCTFDEAFSIGAGAAVSITLTNCTKNGVAVTADNLSSFLSAGDYEMLKTCTIVVDGMTVTLS